MTLLIDCTRLGLTLRPEVIAVPALTKLAVRGLNAAATLRIIDPDGNTVAQADLAADGSGELNTNTPAARALFDGAAPDAVRCAVIQIGNPSELLASSRVGLIRNHIADVPEAIPDPEPRPLTDADLTELKGLIAAEESARKTQDGALSEAIGQQLKDMAVVDSRVSELETQTANDRKSLSDLRVTFDSVSAEVLEHGQKLGSLTMTVTDHTTAIVTLSASVDDHGRRIAAVEGVLLGKASSSDLAEEVTRATKAEASIHSDIGTLRNVVDGQASAIAGKASSAALAAEVTRATQEEASLAGRIASAEASIQSADATLTTHTETLGKLSNDLLAKASAEELRQEVARAQQAEASITGRVSTVETAVTGARAVADKAAQEVAEARSGLAALEIGLDGAATKADLRQEVSRAQQVENGLAQDLTGIRTVVESLSRQVAQGLVLPPAGEAAAERLAAFDPATASVDALYAAVADCALVVALLYGKV